MLNNNSFSAPFSYGQSLPNSSMGSVSRYTNTTLLIGDVYKEQQYWLQVYNYAQQFGIKGVKLEDVLAQLLRTQEKLNSMQQRLLPAAEGYLKWENELNQNVRNVFGGGQR